MGRLSRLTTSVMMETTMETSKRVSLMGAIRTVFTNQGSPVLQVEWASQLSVLRHVETDDDLTMHVMTETRLQEMAAQQPALLKLAGSVLEEATTMLTPVLRYVEIQET